MFYVSEVYTTSPEKFKNKLQEKVYKTLEKLSINFERVETDEVITMEDCIEINKKLNMQMVKTLFLCNRQKKQTFIYLSLVVIKYLILKSLVVMELQQVI